MTHRTVFGLTFKVFSPSLWELVGANEHIALVTIAYSPRQWWIDVLLHNGATHHKGPYRTREQAIEVIAFGKMERSA